MTPFFHLIYCLQRFVHENWNSKKSPVYSVYYTNLWKQQAKLKYVGIFVIICENK